MLEEQHKKIVDSILGQVGGPLSYSDLGIIYTSSADFYLEWDKFRKRIFTEPHRLLIEDKIFLLYIVYWINKKLDWEAQTVTGYDDEERKNAITKLREHLDIKIDFEAPMPELPVELK